MSKEIAKYGVVHYLQKIDKRVKKEIYDPVSYDQWKMLRDLEPTKFINDYDFHVQSKKEQFELEVERKKNCELESKCKHYSLHPADIEKTKQTIKDIEANPRFVKWYHEEFIKKVLNQNKDE